MLKSLRFRKFRRDLNKANNKLSVLAISLLKLQEESGELAHLYMRLEAVRAERKTINDEYKSKKKEIKAAKDSSSKKTIHENMGILYKRRDVLNTNIRHLASDINREEREFRKSRSKVTKALRKFSKALRFRA